MTNSQFDSDTIVIGLGAMGSAATYQLAKRGANVIGIDRFHPPHIFGSTHGDTRITRLAIGEGAEYVPLVMRSHELWPEIEEASGKQIYTRSGGIIIGNDSNPFLAQTRDSANQYRIEHKNLNAEEIRREYPMFNVGDEASAYYESEAGYLSPENAVSAQLYLAEGLGADLRYNTEVLGWEKTNRGFEVQTDSGTLVSKKLLICAGPWVNSLYPEGEELFKTHRQLLYWFPIEKGYQEFKEMPIFIWEFDDGPADYFYGFPARDGEQRGIKVATESYERELKELGKQTPASREEISEMFEHYIEPNLPWLGREPLRTISCVYTNTEEGRFVIDQIEEDLWLASPCSGHGFKHSAAIGEALAESIVEGQSKIDLSSFGIKSS